MAGSGSPANPPAPGSSRLRTSVVIPVLNDAARLRRCLLALSRQTRRPEEVIVVDNGSADDLATVVCAAREDWGLPLRLLHEPRTGVTYATHAGYDAAAYEIIARCDADCVPDPQWLARLVGRLETVEQIGGRRLVAVTGSGRFAPAPRLIGHPSCALYLMLYRWASIMALGHPALWGSNLVMRASWWHEVGSWAPPRPGIHDDFDLSFQLRPHETFLVDRGSVMPVSWRAAVSPRRLLRQQVMARRLLKDRWRQETPWARHRRRIAGRARGAGELP